MEVFLVLCYLLCLASFATPAPGNITLANCPSRCGNADIPYPFGIGEACSFDSSFEVTCKDAVPFINDTLPLLDIMLNEGTLRVGVKIAWDCYDQKGNRTYNGSDINLSSSYIFSAERNMFIGVGCDTIAWLKNSQMDSWTGCATYCNSPQFVKNGTCNGVGCCQITIPRGLRALEAFGNTYNKHENCITFNKCSYIFIAEAGYFNFSVSDLSYISPKKTMPVILDFVVEKKTCEQAKMSNNYACVANNSTCVNSVNGPGYWCNCSQGYQGNPYLKDGCKDIDECAARTNPCIHCINTPGSYQCTCPKGKKGDGLKNGIGCHPNTFLAAILGSSISGSFLLFTSICSIFICQWNKARLQKKKNYQENGGSLLEKRNPKVRHGYRSTMKFKLDNFTHTSKERLVRTSPNTRRQSLEVELKDRKKVTTKVTTTVYKKLANYSDEQFINELVPLFVIKHRNVVKLLGCCLETQNPWIVYEHLSTKVESLYYKIHTLKGSLSLKECLKIAHDVARALAYLHTEATSEPILHKDLNTENILLVSEGSGAVVKLSHFGFTGLADKKSEQNEMKFYLDPEVKKTDKFTEKSDVYSFGVVLVELLTGKKPESMSSVREPFNRNNLQKRVLDDSKGKEGRLQDLWDLAQKCLQESGENRPEMKTVANKLEEFNSFT